MEPLNTIPLADSEVQFGEGEASMLMSGDGALRNLIRLRGPFPNAPMKMLATGEVSGIPLYGSAILAMTASGALDAQFAQGSAEIVMSASGSLMNVRLAQGIAAISMFLFHGFPASVAIAPGFIDNERERTLVAPDDHRRFRQADDHRLLVHPSEHRTFIQSFSTRTLAVPIEAIPPRGVVMLGTVQKRPGDQLDYDIDYSKWFTDSDHITSASVVSSEPAELVIGAIQFSGIAIKTWITGGVLGKSYDVLVTASTAAGRIKEAEFTVRVRNN